MARRVLLLFMAITALAVFPITVAHADAAPQEQARLEAFDHASSSSTVPLAVVPPRSEITSSWRVLQRGLARFAAFVAVLIAALSIAARVRRTRLRRPQLAFATQPYGSSRLTRGPPVFI